MWKSGASIASCRFSPRSTWSQEGVQRPLLLLVAAGRAPGQVRLAVAEREPGAERRARPRARAASDDGRPSSSQNICARVPSGQPSAGITGELCSQPPLGVAESMLPQRSTTSRCTVSPRVGSPAPGSDRRPDGGSAAGPARGRSRTDASSPIKRAALVVVRLRKERLERHLQRPRRARRGRRTRAWRTR